MSDPVRSLASRLKLTLTEFSAKIRRPVAAGVPEAETTLAAAMAATGIAQGCAPMAAAWCPADLTRLGDRP